MAYLLHPDWKIIWLNPDGTWTYSGYSAHNDAEAWAEFDSYLLPYDLLPYYGY